MFDDIFSLISPHYCVICNNIANGLCGPCKKFIQPTTLQTCVLCKSDLKNYSCQSCELSPAPQYASLKLSDELRKLIHAYKYSYKRAFAKTLAELIDEHAPSFPPNTILVPVPTSSRHIRQRGYDHTLNIVRHLAKKRKCDYKPVIKRKTNFRQVGANRQKRFIQAKNAFYVTKSLPSSPTYVIFDDIITTGATISACYQALRLSGASKVQILALANQTLESD